MKESKKKVFIIHGRDTKISGAMDEFLRSIKIIPIDWNEAKEIIKHKQLNLKDMLRFIFKTAQAVIVLLTPDDEVKLRGHLVKSDNNDEKMRIFQARPDVIFETGMVIGYCPERVIIVDMGNIESYLGLFGIHRIKFNGDRESRQKLINALRTAQVEVDLSGEAWQHVGEFTSLEDKEVAESNTLLPITDNVDVKNFTDGELMMVMYIMDMEDRKLGDSTSEGYIFKRIEEWEKKNRLLCYLSSNYDKAISNLKDRRIIQVEKSKKYDDVEEYIVALEKYNQLRRIFVLESEIFERVREKYKL